jgi:hypothetical protein
MPPNLHTLWLSRLPLGVACGCGHRGLVEAAIVGARDGNMQELRTLKLRCQACGARDGWTATVFRRRDEVDAFVGSPAGLTGF